MAWYFIGVYIIKRTYMAAWRYEISLLVLKRYFTCSLRSLLKYFSTLEEKFRISVQPCNILYVLSFCDGPVEVSVITSAARMPTLWCSISQPQIPTVNPQSTVHHQKLRGRLSANLKIIFFAFWSIANKTFWHQSFLNCGFLTTNQAFIYIFKYFLNFPWKRLKLLENVGICPFYRTV